MNRNNDAGSATTFTYSIVQGTLLGLEQDVPWGTTLTAVRALGLTAVDGHQLDVYLLEWPDEATKTRQWAAFMADAEWSEIKRVTSAEHGVMVGEIEDRVLAPLDYSPAQGRSLLKS